MFATVSASLVLTRPKNPDKKTLFSLVEQHALNFYPVCTVENSSLPFSSYPISTKRFLRYPAYDGDFIVVVVVDVIIVFFIQPHPTIIWATGIDRPAGLKPEAGRPAFNRLKAGGPAGLFFSPAGLRRSRSRPAGPHLYMGSSKAVNGAV